VRFATAAVTAARATTIVVAAAATAALTTTALAARIATTAGTAASTAAVEQAAQATTARTVATTAPTAAAAAAHAATTARTTASAAATEEVSAGGARKGQSDHKQSNAREIHSKVSIRVRVARRMTSPSGEPLITGRGSKKTRSGFARCKTATRKNCGSEGCNGPKAANADGGRVARCKWSDFRGKTSREPLIRGCEAR
jgi:hypothetical protein